MSQIQQMAERSNRDILPRGVGGGGDLHAVRRVQPDGYQEDGGGQDGQRVVRVGDCQVRPQPGVEAGEPVVQEGGGVGTPDGQRRYLQAGNFS